MGKDKVELFSTYPPDTSMAWPSIYTGMNPYRLHLGYDSDIPDEMPVQMKDVREKLRGKTFGDYVSR